MGELAVRRQQHSDRHFEGRRRGDRAADPAAVIETSNVVAAAPAQ
jgi:hypothetical protein